jgi:ketosteroid isomerase-like protein
MPQTNVELVRDLLKVFAERDHERAFEFYDPDIEWDASRVGEVTPDLAQVYRGHEGVRDYWRGWLSAWRDLVFDVEDVREGASGEVVALIRNQRQWGRHSGVETEVPAYGLVFTIKEGKVIRWRAFPDQPKALEAAGL